MVWAFGIVGWDLGFSVGAFGCIWYRLRMPGYDGVSELREV